jgi:hypothetical protein
MQRLQRLQVKKHNMELERNREKNERYARLHALRAYSVYERVTL